MAEGGCGGSVAAPDAGHTSGGQPTAPNSTGLLPLSPPKAEVDDSPLQKSMDKNKECKYRFTFNPLPPFPHIPKPKLVFFKTFSSYLKGNTMRLHYKDKLGYAGRNKHRSLFWESCDTETLNAELLPVRAGGAYSYRWDLKC